MTFSSSSFNMGDALNKLRAIEGGALEEKSAEPGMEDAGADLNNANFTRLLARLNAIKDAVTEEHFTALRAGIRSLYMGRRPNLEQMSALMDLLETMLAYIADDQTLFQRLKYDLKQDSADTEVADDSEEPNNNGEEDAGLLGNDEREDEDIIGSELRGFKR